MFTKNKNKKILRSLLEVITIIAIQAIDIAISCAVTWGLILLFGKAAAVKKEISTWNPVFLFIAIIVIPPIVRGIALQALLPIIAIFASTDSSYIRITIKIIAYTALASIVCLLLALAFKHGIH